MQTDELNQTTTIEDASSKEDTSINPVASVATPTAPANSGAVTPVKRSKLSKTLPTDRLIFPKQQDIIRAYGLAFEKAAGPVSIEDLAGFVPMAAATISQANPFFTEVGIITKEGRKFIASDELQSMTRLFQISEQRAWSKLAPLFERAWFGQVLIPKLKFRPMTVEDAVHDLAEAATAEKDHLQQLRLIIDYMLLVGLVQRDGTMIKHCTNRDRPDDVVETPKVENAKPAIANDPDQAEEGLERYSLTLDPASKRRIVLHAPPQISTAELKRIQQWLSFQLIITDDGGGPT